MRTKFIIGSLLISILSLIACEKEPGEGGTSTIRGKVITREYNRDFTILRDVYPAAKEDVYIIYGDDFVYGDRFETNYDGSYEFKYLQEGSYTIFAYSKDSTNLITAEEIAVMKQVEITGKDQVVEVPDIYILK
jgi:hypothetical protein